MTRHGDDFCGLIFDDRDSRIAAEREDMAREDRALQREEWAENERHNRERNAGGFHGIDGWAVWHDREVSSRADCTE